MRNEYSELFECEYLSYGLCGSRTKRTSSPGPTKPTIDAHKPSIFFRRNEEILTFVVLDPNDTCS